MKKLMIVLSLVLAMGFAFTACGSSDDGTAEEETTAVQATEAAAEEGVILDSFTSGTNTFKFINYAVPLADDVNEDEESISYWVRVGDEDTGEEGDFNIMFMYSELDGDATPELLQEAIKDTDETAEDFEETTIGGADALQYRSHPTDSDYDRYSTLVFHDGNYVTIVLATKGALSEDLGQQCYKEVLDSVTIAE